MSWLAPLWRWRGLSGGRPLAGLAQSFVALDLETTGLDPRADVSVAAAAVRFVDGEPVDGVVTLVNPGRPIPPASTAIHGITDEAVVDAPAASEVVRALEHVCAGRVLVGHGVDFDLAVIGRARRAAGLPPLWPLALDTRRLAAALHAGWGDLGLDAVAARVGVAVVGRHTAEGDAIAAGRILTALLPELARRGLRTVEEAVWLQESVVRGT